MDKVEIQKKIYELKSDEEIIEFVKSRIADLENSSVESKVGQGYTDLFQEYISEKTHYKAVASFKDAECPDLIYDDITPYVDLIKEIRKGPWYSEMTLFSSIFYSIYKYLPSDDDNDWERYLVYSSNKNKKVSIKEIRDNCCAFCSEKAGLAHNMFKFLGIDSAVACGYRDSEAHAFNVVYPNGYKNEPMVIYDPSFFVNFVKDGRKTSLGYYEALGRDDYERLISGSPIEIDFTRTEKNYRQIYGFDGSLDNSVFEGEPAVYRIGLSRERKSS